jgi:hypothetical protein
MAYKFGTAMVRDMALSLCPSYEPATAICFGRRQSSPLWPTWGPLLSATFGAEKRNGRFRRLAFNCGIADILVGVSSIIAT